MTMDPQNEAAQASTQAAQEQSNKHRNSTVLRPASQAVDHVGAFRAAMLAAGITPPVEIIDDGKLHRFASKDAGNDDAGWYVLHGDGIPAGEFGDWRIGVQHRWRADIGRPLTTVEESEHRQRMAAIKAQREAEAQRGADNAARKAVSIWTKAKPAPADHPYLAKKGVRTHGVRVHNGALVLPIMDGERMTSLQFIDPTGGKKYLTGGRKHGCYWIIGTPSDGGVVCICEGYATAASVHEATGHPAVVAFDAGGLGPVARKIRSLFKSTTIIVCADDDYRTDGNPGLTKARAAAAAVGGVVAVPSFGADRPDGATDFNDMAQLKGFGAVLSCIESAAAKVGVIYENGVTGVTGVTAPDDAGLRDGEGVTQGVTGVTSAIDAGSDDTVTIEDADRPCYRVFDHQTEVANTGVLGAGVWYFDFRVEKSGEKTPIHRWVCSPIHLDAVTSDIHGGNFGRLIRFRNTLGRWREWAMPMELMAGTGEEVRRELLSMGVKIDPNQHRRLGHYLQFETPKRRILCATQTGWFDGSFVLPDSVIGPRATEVAYQTGERGHDEYTVGGDLNAWITNVAAPAVGNPILMLALSAAFAGPLMAKCNMESGGIHFYGDSSTGKTTAIEAACSVWGGRNYMRSWRATANGLEGVAAMVNDCLLALDEIGQADAREVGDIVYALANGRGKQRAGRSGSARSVAKWRVTVLSSGERMIETAMSDGGKRVKAGQGIRLIDVPVARTHGAWDDLHGAKTGNAFSDAVKTAAAKNHGHAGRVFLDRLTTDPRDFAQYLDKFKATPQFNVDGEGQDRRAAARFALLAMAGELATEYGLTCWPAGSAVDAAVDCMTSWRSIRGKGNDERRQVVEQVRQFIERHGDSRFAKASAPADSTIRDRAGWWADDEETGARVYLFNSSGFKEATKGFDHHRACQILHEHGALPPKDAEGKWSRNRRFGSLLARVYEVRLDRAGVLI